MVYLNFNITVIIFHVKNLIQVKDKIEKLDEKIYAVWNRFTKRNWKYGNIYIKQKLTKRRLEMCINIRRISKSTLRRKVWLEMKGDTA